MTDLNGFSRLSTTSLADALHRENVMDFGIRPLWAGMPRLAGPAFTVQLAPGDNLMLHAAIYRAPAGSVLVVDGCDTHFAVAGGNVCAVAQRRGIAGFIIDGVIRDVAEAQALGFPVFARGAIPIPGAKAVVHPLNTPVTCGGVTVMPGDIVVADVEGIVVIPHADSERVRAAVEARAAKDAATPINEWERTHRLKIDEILKSLAFED